jgi:hypothetical protein
LAAQSRDGEIARMNLGPADSAGRRVEDDLWLQPGAAVAGPHRHDRLVERFEVLAGRVGFQLAAPGSTSPSRARGQSRSPPASPTTGGTPATTSLTCASPWTRRLERRVDRRPASCPSSRRCGRSALGQVNAKGTPDPLWLAAIAHEYADAIRFVSPPALVQAAVFGPLSALAPRR